MEEKIKKDLKEAQLARDEVKVSTLRLLLSEIKYLNIQKNADLTDKDIISVVQKELKKRKEAAAGFRSGNREEAAQKEENEAKILEIYLPQQLSDEELTKIVEASINEIGAKSLQDMGRIISMVMSQAGQGAEGARVSTIVREKLST